MADLTVERFRVRFPEFKEAPEVMVSIAIDDARPWLNQKRYGRMFE